LEEVKEANADYTEIFEITTRYYTLADQQELLENTVQQKDQELSDLKRKIAEYEKEMETKLLGLNVENGHLSNKFNNIDKEKTQLKMQEEENSSKKLSKQRELSMILMAIDNLAEACENRKPNVHKTQFDKKNLVFDFSKERLELAFMQLAEIRHSLSDFKMITKGFKEEEEKLKKKEREKAQSNNNQDINVQNTNWNRI